MAWKEKLQSERWCLSADATRELDSDAPSEANQHFPYMDEPTEPTFRICISVPWHTLPKLFYLKIAFLNLWLTNIHAAFVG